jgi:predicted dehydrogenase
MSKDLTRRDFMHGTAIAAGVTVLADPFSARSYAQNAKPRFANFGVGGRGGAHIGAGCSGDLIAVCDADENTVNNAAKNVSKNFPNVKKFTDFRKAFDEILKDIDAIFVATPDHTHFPIAYTAVKNGKHCYCEKPLTHGIWEARKLAEMTKQKKVATQMGNQGHANEQNRRIVEIIQAGVIGDVKEVHTWTNRPVWPQGIDRPSDTPACPPHINWEAWLNVAPMRPYHPCYLPFKWRGWYDYGCGAVGDMGCHTWDCVWWAMDPGAPQSAELIKIVDKKPETFPRQMIVKWTFDKTAKRPGFVAFWYEGGLRPEAPEEMKEKEGAEAKGGKRGGRGGGLGGSGCLFIGTKGKLLSVGDYGGNPQLLPTELAEKEKAQPTPKTLERSPGHHQEYLMACRGEKPWDFPKSNFTYGGPMVEAMNLANVAMRLEKKIEWDPVSMKCTGCPEADPLIKREYRPGWVTI